MPTYSYRCKACRYEFEEFQTMSDEPFKKCPSCKKNALVRMIGGGAGLHFKGSGFYQTDYKKPGESKTSSSSGKPVKKESKPETKSESKPEAKPADSTSKKHSDDSKS